MSPRLATRTVPDLFEPWARDEFHPIVYSRDRVETAAERTFALVPGG